MRLIIGLFLFQFLTISAQEIEDNIFGFADDWLLDDIEKTGKGCESLYR